MVLQNADNYANSFWQSRVNIYKKQQIRLHRILKGGVWLNFLLLIFEGALRKWILPSLATPLLIIRDPIALIMILITLSRTKALSNVYNVSIFVISTISFFAAITLGHGNLFVAVTAFAYFFCISP